jgi:hypothetical protein
MSVGLHVHSCMHDGGVLCQGLALALEQVMAGLGALELALHQTERLARREDGLSGLMVVSVCNLPPSLEAMTYPTARHVCYTPDSVIGGGGSSRLVSGRLVKGSVLARSRGCSL